MRRLGVSVCAAAFAAFAILSLAQPAAAQVVKARPDPGAVGISAHNTADGRVLFTSAGQALYYYSFQAAGACTGACATAWPPLLAPGPDGPFRVTGGVDPRQLGTMPITDPTGATVYQVTYFGQPLFGFVGDTAPGDINGENVASFNSYWHLVDVDGRPAPGRATVDLESTPAGPALSTPTAGGTFRSLYQLSTDPPFSSTCTGACAAVWPPLLTQPPAASTGAGVFPPGVGVLHRPDGTFQVTYFGHPVYLFAFDIAAGAASGLTNGEDLIDPNAFGIWHLTSPRGVPAPLDATLGSAANPSLGQIAAAPGGPFDAGMGPFTVYSFSADTPHRTACIGPCANAWPPLLTSDLPQAVAGSGITQADLGSIARPDGTRQVTYFGHPLYLFSKDAAGAASGAGVHAFGGTFQAISLSGTPVS